MSNGQLDIVKLPLSQAEAPGPNHWAIIMDSENADALTLITGDPIQAFVLFGAPMEITTPEITADQDNWDPDDILVATVVRMYSDAAWDITGINSTDLPASGKRKTLINVGSFNITLKDQDVGSLTANRFLLLGGAGDIVLQPGDAQDIYYDDTDAKWRSA